MTKQEWLDKAMENRQELISLLADYHPAHAFRMPSDMEITASNAERACTGIRSQIKEKYEGDSPTVKFSKALDSKDAETIMSLLNEAWFGVPESATQAWSIVGFKEAVSLLEDPWENEDETGNSGETNVPNS